MAYDLRVGRAPRSSTARAVSWSCAMGEWNGECGRCAPGIVLLADGAARLHRAYQNDCLSSTIPRACVLR